MVWGFKGILQKLVLLTRQKTGVFYDCHLKLSEAWKYLLRHSRKILKITRCLKSLFEAKHASFQQGLENSKLSCEELLEKKVANIPRCDGFLVPGGFGKRGSEGKILYIKNAREKQLSFLWYLLRISNGNRRIRQKCSRFERCIFCRN